jgi:hypothetical protein
MASRKAMGIFVDYILRAEGSQEEVRERLERVRARCLDLPLRSVGDVLRVEPIYNAVILQLFEEQGHTLPEVVAARYRKAEEDPDHGLRCLAFSPWFPMGPGIPKDEFERYAAAAKEFVDGTDLWRAEDLPEEINDSAGGFTTLTVTRWGVELEFANVMLRYGYMLILHPGEGSETVNLALSTFGPPKAGPAADEPPRWLGKSFTKTQYAKNFIQVHETVCRVLDIVAEEGLLYKGSDNCGYYASRSWKKASKRVNEELTFAGLMGGLMGVAIGNMREEGASVQVIEDNASKAKPVDFSAALAREEEPGKQDA